MCSIDKSQFLPGDNLIIIYPLIWSWDFHNKLKDAVAGSNEYFVIIYNKYATFNFNSVNCTNLIMIFDTKNIFCTTGAIYNIVD